MYQRKSRMSAYKQGRLIEHFVAGSVQLLAQLRRSYGFRRIRLRGFSCVAAQLRVISVESAKERGGHGTAGKVAVFGLFKRNGKVYTAIM